MQARVRKLRQKISLGFLFVIAALLVSCASQKEPPRLVNDPSEHPESTVPWNKPEPWEATGSLGGIADQHR